MDPIKSHSSEGIQDEQKELVRTTFAMLEPLSDQAAALFYRRLFQIAPEVRPLFNSDLGEQGAKLMQMIGVAVAHLDDLDTVTPAIQALGKRHVAYGVSASQYDAVGASLLWTLEQGLGDYFTSDVREAWGAVYSLLADTMKRAAYESAR